MTLFERTGTHSRTHFGGRAMAGIVLAALYHLRLWLTRIAREKELRRAEHVLSSLPDCLLKDMGISRTDIGRRVRGHDR